jgi:hypothetical protein
MSYPAHRIVVDGSRQSVVASAFGKSADAGARQQVIEFVVTAGGFSKDKTKGLYYSATLNQPGKNVAGDIRIGPSAFDEDLNWLAGIVFHELVHSPQYAYYFSKGVPQIDPGRSDTERRMIALDEFEAYSWTLVRVTELSLSRDQVTEIRRRAEFALIDLDEDKAKSLAQKRRFGDARDVLIAQYQPPAAGAGSGNSAAVVTRPTFLSCYA